MRELTKIKTAIRKAVDTNDRLALEKVKRRIVGEKNRRKKDEMDKT